jgi:pyruvate carboxylase
MDVNRAPAMAFARPGMTPRQIVDAVRALPGVCLTSVGMRDASQSDYKNRLRLRDLATLAPIYDRMGMFSAECHGGAKWHVGIMNRRENPFEEVALFRREMPHVLLQTLVRETSLWGYRPYPRNVIRHVVERVDIDVWRCFSFLNDVRNMRTVAETVMAKGRLFSPTISFTVSEWTGTDYYLGVAREMIEMCGGAGEMVLCVKDMAGVGDIRRVGELVDALLQRWPDLVVQYHRHITDGLAIPALLAAARAGARIFDVEEDSLVRFYGHSPILAVQAVFEESGIPVHLDRVAAEEAVQKAREWVGEYEWAESPFRGFDHTVTRHRMPGGAFPSSFEQAEKGEFLHLMPSILRLMSLYNRIVRYFDVTPGSQITWVTCSGMVNRYAKERGPAGVRHLLDLVGRFVEEKGQDIGAMSPADKDELLSLFSGAPGDFKSLLLGGYGRLPTGWPADWVYQSAFGEEWKKRLKERRELSPLETVKEDDLDALRAELGEKLGRPAAEEEFVLYLMHPKDALEYIEFRTAYGEAPLALPTAVWRKGLANPGDKVDFSLWGKPYSIELVSRGAEHEGVIHVVVRVNNKTQVYEVATPRAKKVEVRMARGTGDIGAPINGNIWRVGNPARGVLKTGDIVRKGEEIANLEGMKMENAILAPFDAQVLEVCVKLNDAVQQGQMLFVLARR